MLFSLYMIQNQWNLSDSKLIVHAEHRLFFQSVRLLASWESLKPRTLYYVPAALGNLPHPLENHPDTGFLFAQKPTECTLTYVISGDYAWVQQSGDTPLHPESMCHIFNHLLEIQEIYEKLSTRMTAAFHCEEPIQLLVNLFSEATGNPAYLADWSFRAIAMNQDPDLSYISVNWKNLRERGYLPYHIVSSILQNEEWQSIRKLLRPAVVTSREFSTPFLIYHLRHKNKIQWQLNSTELLTRITPGHEDQAELFGRLMLGILSSNPRYLAAGGEFHEHFFRDVISGSLKDPQVIAEQLAPLSWSPDGLYCIGELSGTKDHFSKMASLYNRQAFGGMSLIYNGRFLTIFPLKKSSDFQDIQKNLSGFLAKHDGYGALSDVFYGFQNLKHYTGQTAQALQLGIRRCCEVRLFLYKDYTLHHMFSLCEQTMDLTTLCHRALLTLRDAGLPIHRDYLQTLYSFLRHDRSLVQTADALNIHRNTLVYRLKKIQELTSLDLSDADTRFHLLLSFEILKYLGD